MEKETTVEDANELTGIEDDGKKEEKNKDVTPNNTKIKVTRNDKGYCCDECGLVSKNLANLKKHMLTHTGERPFKCSTCPKAFRQPHHLVDHQRTHTGERPFKCDECGARFVQKSSLNLHKKKHTGIKPHVCKICGHSAYEKIHLKIHMRTHTGEKPYQCEVCGQTFSSSTRLNFHRMIHSGEKRYKCEECGVHFREKVTLEQHRGVHVNLGPFVCDECGQEFSKLAGLSLHRKVHARRGDYLYVYNKEANEAFKSVTLSKSKEPSEMQKENTLEGEARDKLAVDTEHTSSSTNDIENVSEIQDNIPRSSEAVSDCSIPDRSNVVTIVLSSSTNRTSISPQRKQYNNASDLKLQNVKENLVSSLKEHTNDCFSSDISADQVRAALESGKIVKTEDGDGKGFFIVLPPALRNEEIVFMSGSAQCKDSLVSDPHNAPTEICTRNLSVLNEMTKVVNTKEKLQCSDLCVEMNEEISEEHSSFSIGVNKEQQKHNAMKSELDEPQKMERDIVGDVGRYSQVRKEIQPDGSSLFLWNDELESSLGEVTYIIDEGTEDPMIQSQEVLDTPHLIKPKKRKLNLDNKRKQKKSLMKPGDSTKNIKRKNRMPKEKKIKIPKSYDCLQCGKACRTSSNYISHMRTHSGERPYFCDLCGKGFKQIAHLRSHIRIHTGERPYVCDICHAAFTQSSRLKSHKKAMHTNTEGKHGKKQEKPVTEHKVRNFFCKICEKTFINECYKKEHMKTHMKPKDFKCKICDIQYKTKASLVKHARTHSDHQVVCEICGLGFPNLTALHHHRFDEHDKSVTESGVSDMCISVKIGEEQDFVVINPSIKDSSNEELNNVAVMRKAAEEALDGQVRHKVLQLTEENGDMKSEVLSESHMSKVHVKLEEEIDTNDFPVPSGDLSNKEYNVLDDLKQDPPSCENDYLGKESEEINEFHIFHQSELPEREKIKEKMWSTGTDDTGRKIWLCKMCNRSFLQSSNLHCHMRMHTGEKPYKCNVCSRAFRQITHLKDHMHRHTGIRPHQCSSCGSCFSQRSAATRHIRLAHQGVKDVTVVRNTQPHVKGKVNRRKNKEKLTSSECSNVDANETSTPDFPWVKTCKICNQSYSASYMKTHIRCHSGERPFKCTKCKAAFKQKVHLKSHMLSHSKAKYTFVCGCGMSFKSQRRLCNHKKKCGGDQETIDQVKEDYGCESVSFSSSQISKHKKVVNITDVDSDHSTSKSDNVSFDDESEEEMLVTRKKKSCIPYVNKKGNGKGGVSKEYVDFEKKEYICPNCKEIYVDLSLYKKHILVHGNHLKEVCEKCGAVFRRASALKFHQNVKHGRRDERYKEFNTSAEDQRENEDDEHCIDFELESSDSDNENNEGDTKKGVHTDSNEDKEDLRLRSLTRSKKKLNGNLEKANMKVVPMCTVDTPDSDKINSSNKKLYSMNRKKPQKISALTTVNTKKNECQDALEKVTSNCKVDDTVTEGMYACEACHLIFTRLSKLRYHMSMWCKKQKDSSQDISAGTSLNSKSPNSSSQQVVVKDYSLKRAKKATDGVLHEVLTSFEDDDDHVKPCNKFGDAGKAGGTKDKDYRESGDSISQKKALLVKDEEQSRESSMKAKSEGNAFYCNICSKKYYKLGSYRVHMTTHLNERPFKCDKCSQAFNQKAHLTSHYRRHTGERPYKCPHCSQAFTQPHNLKKHRKKCNKAETDKT